MAGVHRVQMLVRNLFHSLRAPAIGRYKEKLLLKDLTEKKVCSTADFRSTHKATCTSKEKITQVSGIHGRRYLLCSFDKFLVSWYIDVRFRYGKCGWTHQIVLQTLLDMLGHRKGSASWQIKNHPIAEPMRPTYQLIGGSQLTLLLGDLTHGLN